MSIGERVRRKMLARGLTQEELAKLAGVSVGFVSGLLNDSDKGFQVKKLKAIAKVLHCSVGELVD